MGKKCVDSSPQQTMNVKILVFSVNAHQKVTLAEEEFNNQVNRMTFSVDSLPLSSAIPVITQ